MAGTRQKIIETLQSVDTVLITVGKNPSVDALSAALGLTIYLNESGKHATAVMSGDIPPAISFLEPEKTFENSIDSLRDFVIALDKDKADHLRYKLVDDVVKIFITPYRSVITEKDLRYSKGDYNVELVLAIGVKDRDDLDKALASHGRILHDATVATIGLEQSKLGDPDWFNRDSSSLSEMVSMIVSKLSTDYKKMDKRVASALLTGVVAATDRFSNDRTTPESLTVAAELMSHGANQQLIALKLREGSKIDIQPEDGSKKLTRDLEREGRKQGRGNESKKPKNREREKDKTKLSIDHSDESARNRRGDDSRNKKREVFEAKPVETTAPARIGLSEDGTYDPAAALDEALKISEVKRVETNQDDNDKLAEELTKNLEKTARVESPQALESTDNTPLVDTTQAEPSDEVLASAVESVEPRPEEIAPQLSEPVIEQEFESSTLPPVQPASASAIGEVRQNNNPSSEGFSAEEGPTFGGVLNATTERAAETKRLTESEMRNRTILSRSSSNRPNQNDSQAQSPQPNDFMAERQESSSMPSFEMTPPQMEQPQAFEPAGVDPFAGQMIVPPSPTGTLEEIDRLHRQPIEDSEVRDMFEPSSQPLPAPSVPIGQSVPSIDAPNTPPPPPMPDFSNLPPIPTQMPDFSQVPADIPLGAPDFGPENLGQILPPAPPMTPQSQQPNDPGQFQIPNQQQ